MNSTTHPHILRTRLASFGVAILLLLPTAVRADLLFEHAPTGGADVQLLPGDLHFADFTITTPTQINGFGAWITGTAEGTLQLTIQSPDLSLVLGASIFVNPVAPGTDGSVPAARWEVIDGLTFNIQPGSYEFAVSGVPLPVENGAEASSSGVMLFDSFKNFDNGVLASQDAFGARIYGEPLSSVPEPATYGFAGVALLIGIGVLRNKRKSV